MNECQTKIKKKKNRNKNNIGRYAGRLALTINY